jgi:hypothetical protein
MGKIGIILAFLLSVAAAGGSYYLYQGWVEARMVRGAVEAKYDAVEAKYDQAKEKMLTIQSEKEKIRAEKDQVMAKSEAYRAQAEAMQTKVGKLQDAQKLERAAIAKKIEDDQKMIAELQAKMVKLEQKARDAQAACGVTPADLKADPFAEAQSFTSTSSSTTAAAGASPLVFKPVTSVRSTASARPFGGETAGGALSVKEESAIAAAPVSRTPTAGAAEPSRSSEVSTTAEGTAIAKVLTVNRKFNFVVINQGLIEGLKMGDRLKVLKQGREVATVQIEKLYDKFSAATLLEEDPKQPVVEGDDILRA